MREAVLADLPALLALESTCFTRDRFSRQTFRHLLSKAHAIFLVEELNGQLCGYCTVLLRRGSLVARLYNLAVAPACRGQGVAMKLLLQAEQEAKTRALTTMVLEVREDNQGAIAFYTKQAYKAFGRYENYYEDGMRALRMRKKLAVKEVIKEVIK